MEQPLFCIGFGPNFQHGIAGIFYGGPEPVFVQNGLGQNFCLIFFAGRGYFFYVKLFADDIINMGLAHRAGHTVNFQNGF